MSNTIPPFRPSQQTSSPAEQVAQVPETPPTDAMAGIKQAIQEEFEKQFPPRYSRFYTLDAATFSVAPPRNGRMNFSFEADVGAGGFAGNLNLGRVRFSGLYTPATKEATFSEFPIEK